MALARKEQAGACKVLFSNERRVLLTPDYRLLTTALLQRRIAHAEAGAEVFGEQLDSRAVGLRVRLRQVLHGLDQQPLTFHITGIGTALGFASEGIGPYGNSKDFSHDKSRCL